MFISLIRKMLSHAPLDVRGCRVYDQSIKAAVCAAFEEAENKGEFVREVGIPSRTLYDWKNHYDNHGYNPNAVVTRTAIVGYVGTKRNHRNPSTAASQQRLLFK